jgi:hypothetical protein
LRHLIMDWKWQRLRPAEKMSLFYGQDVEGSWTALCPNRLAVVGQNTSIIGSACHCLVFMGSILISCNLVNFWKH